MKVTIAKMTRYGVRKVIDEETGDTVGELVLSDVYSANPYRLYATGRGFVSEHRYLPEAKRAARAYFSERESRGES